MPSRVRTYRSAPKEFPTPTGWLKIFSPDVRLGFLSHARSIEAAVAAGSLPAGITSAADVARVALNDRLDAAVAAFFLDCVWIILVSSARERWLVVCGRKQARSSEVPFAPEAVAMGN